MLLIGLLASPGFAEQSIRLELTESHRADAYDIISQAIASGVQVIVIPDPGYEIQVSEPIRLRSDLELVFEDGVVLSAKENHFKGRGANLFMARDARNITLRGEGTAVLKMRKADYQDPSRYSHSEWRHLLGFWGCEAIRVQNLTLLSSGGDGVYLGTTPDKPYCKDVLLEDLIIDDHHRQGISVISAEDLIVRRCQVRNTSGTAPAAGIDFEPNHTPAGQRLVNCLVEDSVFAGNDNAGIMIYSVYLEGDRPPHSLTFRRNRIENNQKGGARIITSFYREGREHVRAPDGFIHFEDCVFTGNHGPGITVADSIPSVQIRFQDCHVEAAQGAVLLAARGMRGAPVGGVTFENLRVENLPAEEEAVTYKNWTGAMLDAIEGSILVDGRPYPLAERIAAINAETAQAAANPFVRAQPDWRTFRGGWEVPLPTEEATASALTFRGRFSYVVTAEKGQPVDVQLQLTRALSSREVPITVRDRHGEQLATAAVSQDQPSATLSFLAPETGSYRVTGNTGPNTLAIHSNRPGGLPLNTNLLLAGEDNRCYFAVPAGVQAFEIWTEGRLGHPPVEVIVRNAQGEIVASNDQVEVPWRLALERSSREREIWSVQIRMAHDSMMAELRLGQSLEGLIAAKPEAVPFLGSAGQGGQETLAPGVLTGHEN